MTRASTFIEVRKTAAMFEPFADRLDELADLVRDLGTTDRDQRLAETFPPTLERIANELRTTLVALEDHLDERRVIA
jgi:hypothetical protein